MRNNVSKCRQIQRPAILIAGFLLALLIASCTGGGQAYQASSSSQELTAGKDQRKPAELKLLPGCIAEDPDGIELSVEWRELAEGVCAEVSATNLNDARAIYCSLPIEGMAVSDPALSGMEWAGNDALSLSAMAGSGELHVGIAMVHPQDKQGFSGNTKLVKVTFPDAGKDPVAVRNASTPPLQEQSRIDLDYDPGSNNFEWYYRNLGDYDQNGEVNISDLTQVAIHFGKSSGGPFAEETIESVVDGDNNGEINIADITPIGVGYGNRIDSYKIYRGLEAQYPPGPDAPSTIVAQQIVQFGESNSDPAAERLYYRIDSSGAADPSPAYWLRPVDFGTEGIPSLIAGNGNLPPVVSVSASQYVGIAPLQVTLDASSSFDPEGGPLEFVWQMAEISDPGSLEYFVDTGGTLQRELPAGDYGAIVIVRDNDGAYGFASLFLSIVSSPGWKTTELDVQLGETSGYLIFKIFDVDLAEVGGSPWVAFAYQSDLGGARFGALTGRSPAGVDLETKIVLDAEGDVNEGEVEILPFSSRAHVYCLLNKPGTGSLSHYYITPGSEFPDKHGIATYVHKAQDMSVALVDGRPAISYFNETDGHLMFSLADNAQGTNWPTPVTVDSTGNTGQQSNLAVLNDAPINVYYSDGGLRIRYVDSVLNGGQVTWGSPATVKPWPGVIMRDALQILPGDQRWLLIHDTDGMSLLTMTEPDFTVETPVVATTGNSNDLFSTAIINERVCIAWYDRGAQELKYIRSTNEQATAWEAPELIEDNLLVGGLSLAEVAGHPALTWFDGAQQTVHYSILVE